ncbi:MAG: Rieske (2Fe-2S) protein [Candidatus Dormibacteraceae bacterium]
MFESMEERIDRIIEALLRGRRLRAGPRDSPEREAIMAAAQLAAARAGHPRMSPAFRRRLGALFAHDAPRPDMTRRTALGAAAGLAIGTVGAAALARFGPAPPSAGPSGIAAGVMKRGGGRWLAVASLAALDTGEATKVVAGDLVGYVFRNGDHVTGVAGTCSHLPCALDWQKKNQVLNCPCHNVNFLPNGEAIEPNYTVPPLPTLNVKVEGGMVYVLAE